MNTDDFDFKAMDEQEQDTAAQLLINLKQLFDDTKVSTEQELRAATNYLMRLETLHVRPGCDAYAEKMRLQAIWQKRRHAQADINRWMIKHHPFSVAK